MYGTAEADREKSLWPTAELNVSGTTFITLLNNPSALSQSEKNRIIFGVSTCASACSGRKTHRELHASFDYTDNSWEFKNILMHPREPEARLSHDSRPSAQSLECLTQRPDCAQQELGTKLAWFHRSPLKSGDRAQHDYLFLFSAPPHITIKTVLRWQLADRDSKGAENYQENTISRKQHTCFWLYRKVFCQKKKKKKNHVYNESGRLGMKALFIASSSVSRWFCFRSHQHWSDMYVNSRTVRTDAMLDSRQHSGDRVSLNRKSVKEHFNVMLHLFI